MNQSSIMNKERYDELRSEYLESYEGVDLKTEMKNYLAKGNMAGLKGLELVLCDDVVFVTKVPDITSWEVPDFVFGFAAAKNLSKPCGERKFPFEGNERNLEIVFRRPLVFLALDLTMCETDAEHKMDSAAIAEREPFGLGYLFQGYQGSALTVTDLQIGCAEGEGMFACPNLEKLEFKGKTDTGNMSDSSVMFEGCRFRELNLPEGFDTSNCIAMDYMFNNCENLVKLDLSTCRFHTGYVTTMERMFSNCTALEELRLGAGFETGSAETMEAMFMGCTSLKALDLGAAFDTKQVETFSKMFRDCASLEWLELGPAFTTEHATDLSWMFCGCSALKQLDLRGRFDTYQVDAMVEMFSGCESLEKLQLDSRFGTLVEDTATNGMFKDCGAWKEHIDILFPMAAMKIRKGERLTEQEFWRIYECVRDMDAFQIKLNV